MIKRIDKCKVCNKEALIVNRTHYLCKDCNSIRLHGKTIFERKVEQSSKRVKKRRKPTGEKELFLEIWGERPHVCTKCDRYLSGQPLAGYFSHIKSKGAHPELRLDKDNIEIVCLNCHQEYEFN